jgi:hypothetical protein
MYFCSCNYVNGTLSALLTFLEFLKGMCQPTLLCYEKGGSMITCFLMCLPYIEVAHIT